VIRVSAAFWSLSPVKGGLGCSAPSTTAPGKSTEEEETAIQRTPSGPRVIFAPPSTWEPPRRVEKVRRG
jgi:hypothetical protein